MCGHISLAIFFGPANNPTSSPLKLAHIDPLASRMHGDAGTIANQPVQRYLTPDITSRPCRCSVSFLQP